MGFTIISQRAAVVIVSFSNAHSDPRVLKQVLALKDDYRVTVIAYTDPKIDGVGFLPIKAGQKKPRGLAGKAWTAVLCRLAPTTNYLRQPMVRELIEHLKMLNAGVILANDSSMPACVMYAKGARVIFDAHEYYLDAKSSLKYRLTYAHYWRCMLKKYMPKTAATITVSDGLATLYERLDNKRPHVTLNTTNFIDIQPSRRQSGDPIRMIHHGGGMYRRNIDKLIELMPLLKQDYELDLMLVIRDESYRRHLQDLIDKSPRKVRLIPPVPLDQVGKKLSEYDIGIHMLWGEFSNHKFAMPNKIFEFIQGRLAVAVTPNPNMAEFVEKHDFGIISGGYELSDMAHALNALDHDKINKLKVKSHALAPQYSAEVTQKQYKEIVGRIT